MGLTLPHLDLVYIVSCLQGGFQLDALMNCVYRWCVCVYVCDVSTQPFVNVWRPEDQDTNIHRDFIRSSEGFYAVNMLFESFNGEILVLLH